MRTQSWARVTVACSLGLTLLGCASGVGLPPKGPSALWPDERVHRYRNDELGVEIAFFGPEVRGKTPRHPEDPGSAIVLRFPQGEWSFRYRPDERIWVEEFTPSRENWAAVAERVGVAEQLTPEDWERIEFRGFPAFFDSDGDGMWDSFGTILGTPRRVEYRVPPLDWSVEQVGDRAPHQTERP